MRKMKQNQTCILKPENEMLGGMEAAVLREKCQGLIRTGIRHLILDLSNIQMINGPGIEFLASTLLQLKKMRGSLKLKNPSAGIQKILDRTNLTAIFDEMNSVDFANGSEMAEAAPANPFRFYFLEPIPKILTCI